MRRDLAKLQTEDFDIAIVGGGMHGAWIALRGAQAGYRVALIEKDDFGGATSANSLKILHGGLRYLQHFDLARMRSSIKARREFARISPHLFKPLPCVIPLEPAGVRSPWILGPALLVNDVLSADRNAGVDRSARLPLGRLMSSEQCIQAIAPLADSMAVAGGLWWDAVALDASRLCLEALLRAADLGAVIANHVSARKLMSQRGKLHGLTAVDEDTGKDFQVAAKAVVDATGPWAGQLSAQSGLPTAFLPPAWIGGMNIVLRRSLGIDKAVALSAVSKVADRTAVLQRATRELFFVPWRGLTMIGTDYHSVTDIAAGQSGPPVDAVANFVAEIATVAPRSRISLDDVMAVHWGLLPLDASTATLPRKSPILACGASKTGAAGLVVAIGEKLTSAPIMSHKVIKAVGDEIGPPSSKRRKSKKIPAIPSPSLPQSAVTRLRSRYGERWSDVIDWAGVPGEFFQPIHPSVATLGVEVIHAIRQEMALDLQDLVLRRLGLGDTGYPGHPVLARCAEIAAAEFGWTPAEMDQAVSGLEAWFMKRSPQHQIAQAERALQASSLKV